MFKGKKSFYIIANCNLSNRRLQRDVESVIQCTKRDNVIYETILQTEASLWQTFVVHVHALSRSRRIGCVAFIQSRWTLEGVSSPASVVRSIHVTAFRSQAAYNNNAGQ